MRTSSDPLDALKKAVELAGGQSALAREATRHAPKGRTLTQKTIWKWLNRARGPVPTDVWTIPIELAVEGKVSRHELRADLYPQEPEVGKPAGAPALAEAPST